MRLTILILFFTIPFFIKAQTSDKKTIAVAPFTYSGSAVYAKYANNLSEVVNTAVFKTKRFKVVDRKNFAEIRQEVELQKSEDFIEGLVVAQGKKVGAEYILTGHLASIDTQKILDDDTQKMIGYDGVVQFSIKIIEVETGKLIGTETFNIKTNNEFDIEGPPTTRTLAMDQVIPFTASFIIRFIDKYFPVSVKVFEIKEEKKGVARTIIIAGGSDLGIDKRDKLKIVEIQEVEIDGKMIQRNKNIAWVRVVNVEDANFSECKVTEGGEEIVKKLKAGVQLRAITEGKRVITSNNF